MKQLADSFGRIARDLRVSVTDRCNFRCRYCMPAEGLPWIAKQDALTADETGRLIRVFASLGVDRVRLTGGEPLARPDLDQIVMSAVGAPGIRDVSITTNGYLLERRIASLAAAGLTRVNVSLDSLDPQRFERITLRPYLARVLAGLEALCDFPQLRPVKVNVVALPDLCASEVLEFVHLARRGNFEVRFIEFMPLDADRSWTRGQVVTGDQIHEIISQQYELVELVRPPGSTARRFAFARGPGTIGLINPVSQPFCSDCDRLRLTAEGMMRSCLFSHDEVDLRGPMRTGVSDKTLAELITSAVAAKPAGHLIGLEGFKQPDRTMSQIGG